MQPFSHWILEQLGAKIAALMDDGGHEIDRRLELLKTDPMSQPQELARPGTWRNWAGSQESVPFAIEEPTTLSELQAAVKKAVAQGKKIRAVGWSGSWSPLVTSDQVLIKTHHLERVLGLDVAKKQIRVEAGIQVGVMGAELYASDLALPTATVIPYLRIGGVLAGGAHGTGRDQGIVADSLVSLEMVMHDGSVRTFTKTDTEWPAVMCSLGTMGIVYAATFQAVDLFKLAVVDDTRTKLVHDVMDDAAKVKALLEGHDYVEIFWWPTTDYVWLKTWDRTTDPVTKGPARYFWDEVMISLGTEVTALFPRFLELVPSLTPWTMDLIARLVPSQSYVAPAPIAYHYQVAYPDVWDLSYGIDVDGDYQRVVDAFMYVVNKVEADRKKGEYPQNQVLHLRFVNGSDALLAPCFGTGGRMFIEILNFKPSRAWEAHYEDVEAKWLSMGGRPHWGKLSSWGAGFPQPTWKDDIATKIKAAYGARWGQFTSIRDSLDPNHVFTNPYLDALF